MAQPFLHRHSRVAAHYRIIGHIIGDTGLTAKGTIVTNGNMTNGTDLTGKGYIIAHGYATGNTYMGND